MIRNGISTADGAGVPQHITPRSRHGRMRCDWDHEARSRRRAVASLLVFAKELERAGRISKASKGLLKGRCVVG